MSDSEGSTAYRPKPFVRDEEEEQEVDSKREPTVVSEDFKNNVKEWVDLYDKKAEARKHLSVLNKRQKELHDMIIDYMKSADLDGVNIRDGKLKVAQSKTVGSLKKENVQTILSSYFSDDPTQAVKACDFLFDNRGVTIKERLKRTKTRKNELV